MNATPRRTSLGRIAAWSYEEPSITDLPSCRAWVSWFEDVRHVELAPLRRRLSEVPMEHWATVRDQLLTELDALTAPIAPQRSPGERTPVRFDPATNQRLLAGKKLSMVRQADARRSRAAAL